MRKRVLAGAILGAAMAVLFAGAAGAEDPPAMAPAGAPKGLAIINCRLAGDLSLSDCKVTGEAPAGIGLGAMALQMSHILKAPPSISADPSGRVTLPLMFQPGAPPDGDDAGDAGEGNDEVVGQPPALEAPGAAQA